MNRRVNLKYLSFVNSECIYLHTFSKFNKMFLFLSFFFTFLEEIHIETDSGILFHTQLMYTWLKWLGSKKGPFSFSAVSCYTGIFFQRLGTVSLKRQLKRHTFVLLFKGAACRIIDVETTGCSYFTLMYVCVHVNFFWCYFKINVVNSRRHVWLACHFYYNWF